MMRLLHFFARAWRFWRHDNLCLAPWVHLHVNTDGQRKLCCVSHQSFRHSEESWQKHWNSHETRTIRKTLLNGKRPSACQNCFSRPKPLTYRDFFQREFHRHLWKVLWQTTSDGYYHRQPVSFDYRVSNRCQFKCRMCGASNSSEWQKEYLHAPAPHLHTPQLRNAIQRQQKEVFAPELYAFASSQNIEDLYWVGGEPLAWPEHWDVIKKLVSTKKSNQVRLRYNTNLGLEHERLLEWLEYLPQFKEVFIQASLDAVGDVGEFIRTGLNWQLWEKNFLKLKQHSQQYPHVKLFVDVTVTLPGLVHVEKLAQWIAQQNVMLIVKPCDFHDATQYMSPQFLPSELYQELLTNKIALIKTIQPQSAIQPILHCLEELRERSTFATIYAEDFKLAQFTALNKEERLTQLRPQNINMLKALQEAPKIANWWQQIKNDRAFNATVVH